MLYLFQLKLPIPEMAN